MEVKEAIQRAADLLAKARFPVALTGAGISTPSGIPDFRSEKSGLWSRRDPMRVASIIGFKLSPQSFYEWIRPLAKCLLEAQPNPAHYALAKLESLGNLKSIITQNIDMLHSRAGSRTVYEVHGHLREATCIKCYSVFPGEPLWQELLADEQKNILYCPRCNGVLKPNVILFEEQLPAMVLAAAQRDVRQCDVMLIAGSSLEVYPAADLPRRALSVGAKLILVNYEATPYDRYADVVIHGDVAEMLPRIADAVEAKGSS